MCEEELILSIVDYYLLELWRLSYFFIYFVVPWIPFYTKWVSSPSLESMNRYLKAVFALISVMNLSILLYVKFFSYNTNILFRRVTMS